MSNMSHREPFVNVLNGWAVSLYPNGWFWNCPNCDHSNTIYVYTRKVVCETCGTDFIGLLDYENEEE
jgi:hypothetical protein